MELLTHDERASKKADCLNLSIEKEHRAFSRAWALEGEAAPLEGVRSCSLQLQTSSQLRCFCKRWDESCCVQLCPHITLSRWSRHLHWVWPAPGLFSQVPLMDLHPSLSFGIITALPARVSLSTYGHATAWQLHNSLPLNSKTKAICVPLSSPKPGLPSDCRSIEISILLQNSKLKFIFPSLRRILVLALRITSLL